MYTRRIIKQLVSRAVPLAAVLMMAATPAFAAKYTLSDNATIVKGCSSSIEVKIDTEGANVMAGDSSININPSEVTVNQLSIGTVLPMQVFNQIGTNQIKLSGARLPMTGGFKGTGTFGYITFTPSETASSATFTFAPDMSLDNNLVDENIDNVLTQVVSKTYTLKDKYNKSVDGKGFCTPDTTAPLVQFVYPTANSSNFPVDEKLIFALSDNRAGVDINTLRFIIDGVNYTNNSAQATVKVDNGVYRVEVNPDKKFNQGQNVTMSVTVCDLNIPANCTTQNTYFKTYIPNPPAPVCGNSVIESGEQCDDGNSKSADGCSSICLLEIIIPPSTASCSDGLQDQGEAGIDCGGPCTKACPTCVDGTQNQGETGVDCGGPCPACGQNQCPVNGNTNGQVNNIVICHYPSDNGSGQNTNPITMEIPESAWSAHQAHGDTIGACPVSDQCSDVLKLAAPEREKEALSNAESTIQQNGIVEQKSEVSAPKAAPEVLTQLNQCKIKYPTANFDNSSADTDGDGLSDRMECYAETDPLKIDTDGDVCTDYDELNIYFTNPNDLTDCRAESKTQAFSDVLISDPQPGWIIGTKQPEISGKVPSNTVLVLVVATQSEQPYISDVLKTIDSVLILTGESSDSDYDKAVSGLNKAVSDLRSYIKSYEKVVNAEALSSAISLIPEKLDMKDAISADTRSILSKTQAELNKLKAKPMVASASTLLKDTKVGDFNAKNFEEASNPLADKQLYDLVATAYLSDGSQVSSKAVRFSIDLASTINRPIPMTIGGKLIPRETAFEKIYIDGRAYAMNEDGTMPEITIDDERPTVTGVTEFGSQVFAIWNSVVLASSVISDSEQGSFEVKAPRNLETGISHRVMLYAVKTDGNNKIRSESVDVYFKIQTHGNGLWIIYVICAISLLLIIVIIYLRKELQRRRAMNYFKKANSKINKSDE